MTTEIGMRRIGNKLVAIDPVSEEMILELPVNKDLLVKVSTPRNVRQFKLAWALARKLSDACDFLEDSEAAMDFLKIKAKHFRAVHDPLRDITHVLPKSINWASLTQDGFNRLFKRMVYIITTEIIPGLPESSLRDEIEAMVAPDIMPSSDTVPPPSSLPPPHDTIPEGPAEAARKPVADPGPKPAPKAPAAPKAAAVDPGAVWNEDRLPVDQGEYHRYVRARLAAETDGASMLTWFNSDDQWNLRQTLKISIGDRKLLERQIDEKFP